MKVKELRGRKLEKLKNSNWLTCRYFTNNNDTFQPEIFVEPLSHSCKFCFDTLNRMQVTTLRIQIPYHAPTSAI